MKIRLPYHQVIQTGIQTLVFLFFLLASISCRTSRSHHPDAYFDPQDMQADLNWLQSKILTYHPACEDSTTFDSVSLAFQMAFYEAEKPLSETQYLLLIRKTLIPLRCGHTTAIPSKAYYSYFRKAKPKPLFPLQLFARKDGLTVRYNGSNDSTITVGNQLININQEHWEILTNRILEFIPGDGYHSSFKRFHLSLNFPTYYLFLKGPSYSYEAGILDSVGRFSSHVFSLRSSGKASTRLQANRSILPLKSEHSKMLGLVASNPAIGYLKLDAFSGSNGWYKSAFEEIKKRNLGYLILDLRGNSGGSLFSANNLLTYLLPDTFSFRFERIDRRVRLDGYSNMSLSMRFTLEMFRWLPTTTSGFTPTCHRQGEWLINRFRFKPNSDLGFKGKLVVLMDGGTFSSASLVAAALRKRRNAALVGEESGGAAGGSFAMITPTLELPRTKMRVTLPLYRLNHEMGKVPFRGLLPDVELNSDIILKIKGIDSEIEYLAKRPEIFTLPSQP